MKRTRLCVQCQSSDIARVPGYAGTQYSSGSFIPIGKLGLGVAKVSRFVCLRCGFVESWVESSEDLDKIRKKYKRED